MRTLATAVAVASLVVASVAAAQAPAPGQPAPQRDRSQAPERRDADRDKDQISKGLKPGTVKASDIIGKNVENRNGDNLGEIKDLLIDRSASKVAFVVFEPSSKFFSGTETSRTAPATPGAPPATSPGTAPAPAAPGARTDAGTYRDQYYAVPWSLFSESDRNLVLAADRDKILNAPHFNKDKWPDMADTKWREDVFTHYGVSAEAQGKGDRLVRAHDFLKKDVRNPQNEKLGDIQDIVLEMKSGRVLYAVMATGGFLGLGEKLFAIPVSAFSPSTDGKDYVLNADKDRLKQAQGFDKNNWPATASREWAESQGGGQPQRQPARPGGSS